MRMLARCTLAILIVLLLAPSRSDARRANERSEGATRAERGGRGSRERACRGVRRGEAPRKKNDARQAAPAQSKAQAALTSEVSRLIQLLELGPESFVADIGAGSGEVSIEIARQLGPRSRVYSTDIASKQLAEIKDAAAKAGLTNVTVVEGAPAATNLPDACCDALFVRYVYHHFADPPAMNASILRSLKPGGRFAVMDFTPKVAVTGTVPPSERGSGDKHGVVKETVVEELKAVGFEIVQVLPEWQVKVTFLVLARKPA